MGADTYTTVFEEHGHGHAATGRDNNMRAAIIHVIADAAVSVLVIVGLLLARAFGWLWMDPLAGIIGACVIASWSYGLIRDTGAILLDRIPDRRLAEDLRTTIESDGSRLADLHLWRLGPGQDVYKRQSLGREMIDQLLRKFKLGFRYRCRLDAQLLHGTNLSLEMQLMHGKAAIEGSNDHNMLLAAGDPSADGTLFGLFERRCEQRIGFGAAFIGREVIGPVEIHGIYGLQRDELGYIDRMGGRLLERLDFRAAELYVLTLCEFVALSLIHISPECCIVPFEHPHAAIM